MYLAFRHSFTHSSPVLAGAKVGLRLDRVLVCAVMQRNKSVGSSLHVSHAYKLEGRKGELGCEYRFDVVAQGSSRMTWLHREEQGGPENAEDELSPLEYFQQRPYVQPTIQVCARDLVEISVNLFSGQGMLDLSSVEWFAPKLSQPSEFTGLTYSKNMYLGGAAHRDMIVKIQCDLSRVCEVEDQINEWYDHETYSLKILQPGQEAPSIDLWQLQTYFEVLRFESTQSDGFHFRLHLRAKKEGSFFDRMLGLPVVIKQGQLTHEVKRNGYLIDRFVDLQLRLHDELLVYITQPIINEF